MRFRLALVVAVAALVVAACGATASQSPSPEATIGPTTEPTTEASESPPATSGEPSESAEASPSEPAGEALVTVVDSDLGQILADADGNVLYGFTDDTAGEPTCYDSCAENWPPLLSEDGEISVGGELDDAAFSTVERTDGGEQVKVGDWPLYTYAADAAPGDTNGQGVGGKWFVVGTDGELIRG